MCGGDFDAHMARACLERYGWPPSQYLNLSVRERAFVCASLALQEEGGVE